MPAAVAGALVSSIAAGGSAFIAGATATAALNMGFIAFGASLALSTLSRAMPARPRSSS